MILSNTIRTGKINSNTESDPEKKMKENYSQARIVERMRSILPE